MFPGFSSLLRIPCFYFVLPFLLFAPRFSAVQELEQKVARQLDSIRLLASENPVWVDSVAREIESLSKITRNDSLLARSREILGLTNYYQSYFLKAANYYNRALESNYAATNSKFASGCWNNLGIVMDISNQYNDALHAYLQSLKLAEAMRDSTSIFQSCINLGYVYTMIGEREDARRSLDKAVTFFESKEDLYHLALCYQNLGVLYEFELQPQKAVEYLLKADQLFEKLNLPAEQIKTNYNLAAIFIRDEKPEEAKQMIDKAFQILESYPNLFWEGSLNMILGEYHLWKKNFVAADTCLSKAQVIMDTYHIEDKVHGIMGFRLILESMAGKKNAVWRAFAQYDSLTHKIIQNRTTSNLAEMRSIYELDKKSLEIDQINAELARKKQRLQLWISFGLILLALLVLVLSLYLKNQQQTKALFERNMELTRDMEREFLSYLNSQQPEPDFTEIKDNASKAEQYRFLELYEEIKKKVAKERLYLNPDLTIQDIAFALKTNEKYISKAISLGCHNNFNFFINTFRINEAKKLLVGPEWYRLTIYQVAEKSGFKNASTFQRNFKKLTGLTPSAFKRMA